jgi:hypothetical protein
MAVGVYWPVLTRQSVPLSAAIMNENTPAGPQMPQKRDEDISLWANDSGVECHTA